MRNMISYEKLKMLKLLILILLFSTSKVNPQNLKQNYISDKGYVGIAYLSKQATPNWGFLGGWTRYYSK